MTYWKSEATAIVVSRGAMDGGSGRVFGGRWLKLTTMYESPGSAGLHLAMTLQAVAECGRSLGDCDDPWTRRDYVTIQFQEDLGAETRLPDCMEDICIDT